MGTEPQDAEHSRSDAETAINQYPQSQIANRKSAIPQISLVFASGLAESWGIERSRATLMAITPYLYYEDVDCALRFLAESFGFRKYGAQMRHANGQIYHAA